ncbi:hypothetical protein C5167_016826 [Papaver somniferum]|nr:hypothetical protein C5167_016826 [Papaver somniferum]
METLVVLSLRCTAQFRKLSGAMAGHHFVPQNECALLSPGSCLCLLGGHSLWRTCNVECLVPGRERLAFDQSVVKFMRPLSSSSCHKF